MLIPSKLSRPVRLDHTVVRERLLAKLSGANNFRLRHGNQSWLWGKARLIYSGRRGQNVRRPIGERGDNQQERFASYLIAAINGHHGGLLLYQRSDGAKHLSVCQPDDPPSRSSFVNWRTWHRPLYHGD